MENYAFTLQIPRFKKVNFNGCYIPYGNLSNSNQELFMRTLLNRFIQDKFIKQYEAVSELHSDGRVHMHGTIYDLATSQHTALRECICLDIGIKQLKQQTEIFCILPIYHSLGWSKYCYKQFETDSPRSDEEKFERYLFKGKKENGLKE